MTTKAKTKDELLHELLKARKRINELTAAHAEAGQRFLKYRAPLDAAIVEHCKREKVPAFLRLEDARKKTVAKQNSLIEEGKQLEGVIRLVLTQLDKFVSEPECLPIGIFEPKRV